MFILAIHLFLLSLPKEIYPQQEPPLQEETQMTMRETIFDWIQKGGPTMYVLGLISSIIIGFSIERYIFFKRSGVKTKNYFYVFSQHLEKGLNELETFLNQDRSLISRVLQQGIHNKSKGPQVVEKQIENAAIIEVGRLEKGLNLLSNLGNLAPLVGFFGTVIGMRNSFIQFTIKVAPTARDLAAGVEEALITTQAGLLIAIPTYLIFNLFIYWIDTLTIEIERCGNLLINKLQEDGYSNS
ncbi:MAG: MotA/TolQ/ExbB proton channel family protein [Leptospiraceae bacterium]|nr:MotA/TolQ/ExbB proton channel family protein [Leptospiraceae bacterium]MDW7975434.1 MotA/TolQ/ExbB proton channel family protein [Leptospiraceae bacterium]